MILALVPVAFGVYLKRGRPFAPRRHRARSGDPAVLVALLPLSAYAIETKLDDSPFLWAVAELEGQIGVGDGSLVFALAATVAAVLAAAVAWTRLRWAPITVALLLLAAFSVAASIFDVAVLAGRAEAQLVAPDPAWVDAAALGPVSAIETPQAPPGLIEQLFWNPSIVHELLLGAEADATDTFTTERLAVGRDGTLLTGGRPLQTAILFDGFLATPVFRGVSCPPAASTPLSLWRRTGTPRLRLLELGRYPDGWLDPSGSLEVWPGSETGTVRFILSRSPGTPARFAAAHRCGSAGRPTASRPRRAMSRRPSPAQRARPERRAVSPDRGRERDRPERAGQRPLDDPVVVDFAAAR